MAQDLESRPRRNSDASIATEFSWQRNLPIEPRYGESPIETFRADFQRLDRLLSSPEHSIPRRNSQFSDNYSTASATDGRESTVYRLRKAWNWHNTHSTSSIPTLMSNSSSASSISDLATPQYSMQMYGISSDSFGNLHTNNVIASQPATYNIGTPREEIYKCLFAFAGCSLSCTRDNWREHVTAHLSNVEPPESCTCSICDETTNTNYPALTWNRFLNHILSHIIDSKHFEAIKPDKEFLEFCLNKEIISEFTAGRFDTSSKIYKNSSRSNQSRQREYLRTPRSSATVHPPEIAEVIYPIFGTDAEVQQETLRDVMFNCDRTKLRAQKVHRS